MPPSPSGPAADRNLLFGILALQMDFVSRDGLITAMHAWVLDKAKPLGDVLRDRGDLDAETYALLDAMVRKHLALHGNDPQKSLAAVSSLGSVREEVGALADRTRHRSGLLVGAGAGAAGRTADVTAGMT